MAYNRKNKLLYFKNVIDIVNQHYEEGVSTYKGIWQKYVNPIYPMSYGKFMEIVNMPNIDKQLAEEMEKTNSSDMLKNQLKLFNDEDTE